MWTWVRLRRSFSSDVPALVLPPGELVIEVRDTTNELLGESLVEVR